MPTTRHFGNMLNEKISYSLSDAAKPKKKRKSAWGEISRKESDIRAFPQPRQPFKKGKVKL